MDLSEQLLQTKSREKAVDAFLKESAAAIRDLRDLERVRISFHDRISNDYRSLRSALIADGNVTESSPALGLNSSSAWKWASLYKKPVQLLASTAEVSIFEPQHNRWVFEASLHEPTETIQRLDSRKATHLIGIPLCVAETVAGMLTLEFNTLDATLPFTHPVISELLRLANLAAPWLLALNSPASLSKEEDISVRTSDPDLPVLGESMRRRLPMLRAFAAQRDHLLISGRSGVGKSMLARWCHKNSPYSKGPFEVIDLLSVPADMQMAELVGWERGAFTSASTRHEGAFSRADGGTLFIDEVDKLSLDLQAGLLGILETGSYRVLGAAKGARHAKVRFLFGTNQDLAGLVNKDLFREDLYYRINVLAFRLPDLSERRDEIAAWAKYLVDEAHLNLEGEGKVQISSDALNLVTTYEWPGNIRQLKNCVRRAYAIAQAECDTDGNALISPDHIRWAMGFEDKSDSDSTLSQGLLATADRFLDIALLRERSEQSFDINAADVLKGIVLARALERFSGDAKKVFTLFGREQTVTQRNHRKLIRKEIQRASKILKEIGEEGEAQRILDLLEI